MSNKLSEFQNFEIGVMAAFIEGVILQPTLYWKNAKAQKLPFSLNPKVIYRGTSASIFNEMQMMGLQFVLTRLFQRIYDTENGQKLTQVQEYSSAFLGGSVAALFAAPVEHIMIQQQRFGGSMIGTLKRLVSEFGIKKMTRGMMPAVFRDSIYVSGMLGVTPILQNILVHDYEMSLASGSFWASMLGGVVAAIPSHPFDIVKTCMQGDTNEKEYSTVSTTVRKLYSEGKVKRFFDGCFWRTFNIVATVYIANECRNRFPSLLFGVEID